MPRYIPLLVPLLFFATGCASHKQFKSLEASYVGAMSRIEQQAERLELQDAYLRYLEDEQAVLSQQVEALKEELAERAASAQSANPAAKRPIAVKPRAPKAVTNAEGKLILGRSEWVWFDLFKRDVKVAVEADRKFSVLSVADTQSFERDGRSWVRFTVALPDKTGAIAEPRQMEAPLARTVKLRSPETGELESRPVVRLTIKIGRLVEEAEFALAKSASGATDVALGRAFLRDIAVVDSSRSFIQPQHSSR